jgi:hypothetical protein
MVPENINNKTTVFATLTLMLLPLSATSLMAIGTPNYASAQGLFEGLEREQSGEGVPGGQPADTGGALPLNDTTTAQRGDVQGGGGNATNATMTGAAGNATNATMTGAAGNATNATMTGAAGNATTTGDGGTTAGGNQTGGGQ